MIVNKEILALLHLMDDPDAEVFDSVADRLLHYGKEIIPTLEKYWETTEDEAVQNRIENLIHRALFTELQEELLSWAKDKEAGLLNGAIIIAKFRYPDLNMGALRTQFEQIKRNVWLELNNYLTPLEQINVINGILYNYYKLNGREITDRDANLFFVNNTLENKQGNAYSIGIIYLAICELLDVPVFAINLPKQFVIAYFDSLYQFQMPDSDPIQTLQFYIDPVNGMVYTQQDVEVYLKKINVPKEDRFFDPMSNKAIIIRMLDELAQTYEYTNQSEKSMEIQQLIALLDNEAPDAR